MGNALGEGNASGNIASFSLDEPCVVLLEAGRGGNFWQWLATTSAWMGKMAAGASEDDELAE